MCSSFLGCVVLRTSSILDFWACAVVKSLAVIAVRDFNHCVDSVVVFKELVHTFFHIVTGCKQSFNRSVFFVGTVIPFRTVHGWCHDQDRLRDCLLIQTQVQLLP